MPLPTSTSIPLMGCSRPGEVAPSKPKQAMIVRMSAEAFDALQAFPNHPQMFFQFDEKSGIYIGDTFFPMRPMKEETLHELYLRSASVGKKPTSLKLHANVTGKFFVERAFSERVQGKIRETTINTAKQNERNIIVIDTPPDLAVTTHPRKRNQNPASTMFRSTVRPGDLPKSNVASSLPPARVSSPIPPKAIKKDKSAPLRKRFVHCLAVCERTREQTVKLVGGAECDPSVRREILGLLDDMAEQAAVSTRTEDQAAQNWRLKPEAWLEVRPYEWPKLTEAERTNMARTARQKLRSLRIPETDAAWEHVKFRTPPGGIATSSTVTVSSNLNPPTQSIPGREPKRGVTSKEAREKKARPKPDPKAEIMMKDESIRVAHKSGLIEGKAGDVGGSGSPPKPIVRKTPGSGFRVGHSPSQDGRSDTAEGSGSNKISRNRPVDVRSNKDRDPPSNSSTHPPPRPTQKEGKLGVTAQIQRIKQIRESGGGGTDSDREKVPTGFKDKPRVKQRDDQERRPIEEKEGATLKRKKVSRDGDEYDVAVSRSVPQKKRKTDNGTSHHGSIPTTRTGEASLPARPGVAPSSHIVPKKEHSPSPALSKNKKENQSRSIHSDAKGSPQESRLSSQARKANVTAKARRRSPIYTTSEDDSDPRRSTQDPKPLPTPPLTSEHTTRTTHPNLQRPRIKDVHPLPTDHASLRNRYNAAYREYLATFQKLVAQKGKLDSMLMSHEISSVGSITDSDGDVELLDTEELMKLKSDHSRLKDELTTILEIFVP